MTKINFKEYGVKGRKSGICPICWKKASRSTSFWQTQSQFNTNPLGQVKTVKEIMAENKEKLFKWESEPVYHAKCELNQTPSPINDR